MSDKKSAAPAAKNQAPERKAYNFAQAKAQGKVAMTEATPLSGFNGDIISLTDVMKVGDAYEATLLAIETRGTDDDGKDRIVYVMKDLQGEEFGVWGRGGLNLMNRVPLGTFVRVTYSAFDKAAKRPTPQHQFKIELEEGVRLLPLDQAFVPPAKRGSAGAEARN